MAFNTRIFAYRGIIQMPLVLPKQFSSDSIFQLIQPYEWSAVLSVSGSAISSAADTTHSQVQILRVEVPDGQTVRYEINPPNRTGGAVSAGNTSPSQSGYQQYFFQPGWTISLVDASSFP